MSVRSRTGVLGKGTPRVPPGEAEPDPLLLEIAKPVQNNAKASVNAAAITDFKGGIFRLTRQISFNRLEVRVSAFTDPATGIAAIYQRPDGRFVFGDSVPLVDAFTIAPTALQTLTIAPNTVASIQLVPGWYWLVWGQDSGAGTFGLEAWDTRVVPLMNQVNTLSSGEPPTQFSTNIAAAGGAPAQLNPVIDADVAASSSNALAIHRLRTV